LLLLLGETYLLRVYIEIHASKLPFLNEFVFASGCTVLLVLLRGVVLGEAGCLCRQKLCMLIVQLARGHPLELALRAHVLSAFCEPFLHYEPTLLPPLDSSITTSCSLRLILNSLALTRR
jgi:hypothetical protein